MIGVGFDITERKEREQELRRHEAYIEHSSDIITVLDEAGRIQYQSPSLERIVGYEPNELIGDSAAEYIHPDDRARVMGRFFEVIDQEDTVVEEITYRFKHADGVWVWLESSAVNKSSSVAGGYIINSREISERKNKEDQLRLERDRFEEFASVLSHDLRNPLNVAMGQLELAKDTGDIEHLVEVSHAHSRMQTLIDDMLSLGRAGREIGEMDAVDLSDIARHCWDMVATSEAELEIEETLAVQVEADQERLQQVFENIYRNAIEHGGDDVTITVGRLSPGNGFFIEDDGPGIPIDEREKVFEPGFTSAEGGTGFGLSIVRDIVQAHGWEIEVTESEEGGARVEITGFEIVE
jgi:PAS domain S-box-containing protein